MGDLGLSFGIYGVAALAAGRLRWGMEGGWNVYLTASILGAMSATAIEWWALADGSRLRAPGGRNTTLARSPPHPEPRTLGDWRERQLSCCGVEHRSVQPVTLGGAGA